MGKQSRHDAERRVILAFYAKRETAEKALRKLMDENFPADRISLLGKASSSGDDPLGVYYSTTKQRMQAWGGMGAFWGGLWGLLSGTAGMFLFPGIGPVMAAGPIVEALVSGAAGAGVGAGVMAGGAAATQLAIAAHRMGVPQDRLQETQRLLDDNHYLMLLIVGSDQTARWRKALAGSSPDPLWDYPYVGLLEGVKEVVTDKG